MSKGEEGEREEEERETKKQDSTIENKLTVTRGKEAEGVGEIGDGD